MKIVIVGTSFAGITLARKLQELDSNFDVELITKERNPYKKNLLLRFLKDEIKSKELLFSLKKLNVIRGKKVMRINLSRKNVLLDDNSRKNFDFLVICTGSRPKYLGIPGIHKRGVASLCTLEDVKFIKDSKDLIQHIILYLKTKVGLEILELFSEKKDNFKIIIPLPEIFQDSEMEKVLELAKEKGIEILLKRDVKQIIGNGDVKAIELDTGKIIACDLFITDTGLKPNLEILRNTSLEIEDCLKVNENFETNIEGVFGLGDVIEQDLERNVSLERRIEKIEKDAFKLAEIILNKASIIFP